ncbi:MAG: M64 family metallopeptidase [Myxococcales bacterium]
MTSGGGMISGGGMTSAAGAVGTAGAGVAGSFVGGGTGGGPAVAPLDCGKNGTPLENHGPPANRLNYVIVGDGYSEQDLAAGGALDKHMEAMLAKRFSEIGQPYLRYRNFINICVLRLPSTPICGSSKFGCCGDDQSRLANCNTQAVNAAITENVPKSFEVDWRSVVLNGSSWWNSGGSLMMWSGGNKDAGGAATHEGAHGFHSLSDEYGNCEVGRVSGEATYGVNVSLTNASSKDKWDGWLDYTQTPGTGKQGFFGCDGGQTWRPTDNSMMNSLFGNDPNTSYNAVSREKIVMDIWRVVMTPYDSVEPAAGPVTNPTALTVNVIDAKVINVDWSVDGNVVAMNGGPTYAIGAAKLAPGTHMVTARAYDNAGKDLVRQVPGTTFNRQYWGAGAMGHSDKTVAWTVTIQ